MWSRGVTQCCLDTPQNNTSTIMIGKVFQYETSLVWEKELIFKVEENICLCPLRPRKLNEVPSHGYKSIKYLKF